MARPRGEVRRALAAAIERLYVERGAVSSRQVAEAAQVGFDLARETMKDMQRAGEIVKVGNGHEPGERWHSLYEPASVVDDDCPQPCGGIEALAGVMKGWSTT